MYIKRLEKYSEDDWKKLLSSFSDNRANCIRRILSFERKEDIEANFDYLRKVGIINGIGTSLMSEFCRNTITFLAPGVRFEFHDIEYFIGGTREDRRKADYGFFKYSILSIAENFRKLHSMEIIFFLKEFFIAFYTVFAILKLLILILFWRILVYFGGKAFNF